MASEIAAASPTLTPSHISNDPNFSSTMSLNVNFAVLGLRLEVIKAWQEELAWEDEGAVEVTGSVSLGD
ncbi:hypothetical protein NEOLEDRAFT_1143751 [Neolentinus lepideus HHB14362 ss-1]|uniref:Uncharacterized protein n=1 Tax=Neolentinus lepideus HHB14362 ss-1 TaxID=1314782 RepID=A0A165MCF3_9AGAM|nr:hypothetical protein NEOLEDRAFT_1143751 [Neolentinus lepideus HHB14362 ss-1]